MSHCEWAVCGYELTGSVVKRTHPWTHYLPNGPDHLPAATGMYFNLIINRIRPTYNNETNTKKPSYPHTVRHVYVTPHIVTPHTNMRL